MLADPDRVKIVITNFHGFKRREAPDMSKPGRALLQGHGPDWTAVETEGHLRGDDLT